MALGQPHAPLVDRDRKVAESGQNGHDDGNEVTRLADGTHDLGSEEDVDDHESEDGESHPHDYHAGRDGELTSSFDFDGHRVLLVLRPEDGVN